MVNMCRPRCSLLGHKTWFGGACKMQKK